MKYNFDELVDRRGTNALKWDIEGNELPMWVADMDFRTAPAVIDAVCKRAAHGVYGYNVVPDEWTDSIVGWWERRHGYEIPRDRLIFCTGVVAAISSAVRKLTTPHENVVVQTPVYNIFFNSIVNNGRRILEAPLKYDGESYSIDFDDLESKLAEPETTLMIVCNPHNPVGKIWDKKTLAAIGSLCKKHGVTVLSDEIHCDLTDPGKGYVPFASASPECADISVTCISASKAFNLAGLQSAAVFASNRALFNKINRALNTDEVAEPNTFAVCATVAAFNEGGEWLDELREYIYENKKTVREFISANIPQIKVVPSEATYLLWLDCNAIDNADTLAESIRRDTGLYLSGGAQYGGNGKGFLRMNVACPRSMVIDGLNRLKKALIK
ncbi:MAG: pyridoxal phosphate-dependent aminotransferase [Clostridiales bacterium]|nr:pyridoxal phosphate-dependent aminotransferase [Clostridiales bacterium]